MISPLENFQLTAQLFHSVEGDAEIVAHLLPCKHNLHNECLKPWVERANSCPICRAAFNMVELSTSVGGKMIDSYAVQDKAQEPEVDPAMIVEDEMLAADAWEPCLVCGNVDDVHEVMFCDGCDKSVHVFCAGFEEAPEVWYCETCLVDMETDTALPGLRSALRRPSHQRERRRAGTQQRGRRNDAIWARVWHEVSRRLDFDLDFPFDDEVEDQRTDEQRREFARWQRRFEVADRQGTASRLRGIAARLQAPEQAVRPAPESQEELRAWNAFEKARSLEDGPSSTRRKRRRTASPASPPQEPDAEQRQLKRPRLRRPPAAVESPAVAEPSNSAAQRASDGPTFLSSLLREVEQKPVSAGSPGASEQPHGQHSPLSPMSSGYSTPRALSDTPPPQGPLSPPLSSTILPPLSPTGLIFSPFSPTEFSQGVEEGKRHCRRGRTRDRTKGRSDDELGEHAMSSLPNPELSYSSKEEIQRMVKLALGPRYREKGLTKEQYTDINRDVSRMMYNMVGDASALTDEEERAKWQGVAEEEVTKAIASLAVPISAGSGS